MTSKPIVIGVAGGTGSGKTTVSQAILSRVGPERISFLQHDSYYRDFGHLSIEERTKINWDHPAALDNELLVEHLDALCQGKSINVPIYDFACYNRRAESMTIAPNPVILVEGILIFAERALRERMEVKIYVDADADLRFIRRLKRDLAERGRSIESIIDQYVYTVRPMHMEFVEPTKRYADVIIPRGGLNAIAIDMVVARVERLLAEAQNEREA